MGTNNKADDSRAAVSADHSNRFYRRSKEQYIADILRRAKIKKHRVYNARAVGGGKPKKEHLAAYNATESVDYLPADHKQSYGILKERSLWDERKRGAFLWIVYGFVGFITASLIFILLRIIKIIEKSKTKQVEKLLAKGYLWNAWLYWTGVCAGLAMLSCMCVLYQPAAAASGIPGLLAYLNGASLRKQTNAFGQKKGFLSTGNLLFKWLGTVCSIPSGLAVGPEGPIIHIGAMLGKHVVRGVYWFDECMGYKHRPLQSNEKRDFLATGAGCGISAAFHAPMAGVMFVVEEASSFITVTHIEQSFFASVVAYWVVWGIEHLTSDNDSFVKFDSPSGVFCSLYSFSDLVMFMLMGVVGGLTGALFNFIVEQLNELRRDVINPFPLRRVAEVLTVAVLTSSVAVLLPLAVPCRPMSAAIFVHDSLGCMDPRYGDQLVFGTVTESFLFKHTNGTNFMAQLANGSIAPDDPRRWEIPFLRPGSSAPTFMTKELTKEDTISMYAASQYNCKVGEYNELAMLFLKPGTTAVTNMFLRGAPHLYSGWALLLFFCFYFFLASITSGISVPAGLVVPMMLLGGAFGRLVGLLNVEIKRATCKGLHSVESHLTMGAWAHQYQGILKECGWPDPGSYALVGAAAIMGGTGRITIFLAVVLLEITNDIKMLPPIAFAVIIAMWVGNSINHGLYHALIPVLNIPYLNNNADFEMNTAHTVELMASPLVTVPREMTGEELRAVLDSKAHNHNAFPVVDPAGVLVGLVTRGHLKRNEALWWDEDIPDKMVYLSELMDRSPITVYPHTPVARTYHLFRSMGMRHLVVVERNGMAAGMVTRKDLQRWRLYEVRESNALFAASSAAVKNVAARMLTTTRSRRKQKLQQHGHHHHAHHAHGHGHGGGGGGEGEGGVPGHSVHGAKLEATPYFHMPKATASPVLRAAVVPVSSSEFKGGDGDGDGDGNGNGDGDGGGHVGGYRYLDTTTRKIDRQVTKRLIQQLEKDKAAAAAAATNASVAAKAAAAVAAAGGDAPMPALSLAGAASTSSSASLASLSTGYSLRAPPTYEGTAPASATAPSTANEVRGAAVPASAPAPAGGSATALDVLSRHDDDDDADFPSFDEHSGAAAAAAEGSSSSSGGGGGIATHSVAGIEVSVTATPPASRPPSSTSSVGSGSPNSTVAAGAASRSGATSADPGSAGGGAGGGSSNLRRSASSAHHRQQQRRHSALGGGGGGGGGGGLLGMGGAEGAPSRRAHPSPASAHHHHHHHGGAASHRVHH